ncbi:unnamed protein product [Cyprideis torosa]|uniref:ER membrane protein complex subunit 2 n=1 Tax=Cyprideis torosa TaxID=163714 RepID=A0A7R8W8M4_9CRUS|nr:unnamed protein product [Cyprideis torosa]CAG0888742.1 unnamed protein product [Cyprideis torosa]
MNWEEAAKQLRNLRDESRRDPREVIDIWNSTNIKDYLPRLGSEHWLVLEQVLIASLDIGRRDITEKCLNDLNRKFPKSNRVAILRGMVFEADKKFHEAGGIYDKIIAADETNSIARKRRVALFRAQGKVGEAIKELSEYLKTFMADQEAWMELGELYVLVMDYAKAAFCIEELILSNPHNHLYYQRYAEIRYTQGGMENLELAKSYFSQTVKLNSGNVRALYGLILTSAQLASSPKTQAVKKAEYLRLAAWARERLQAIYSEVDQTTVSDDIMTGTLGITLPVVSKDENFPGRSPRRVSSKVDRTTFGLQCKFLRCRQPRILSSAIRVMQERSNLKSSKNVFTAIVYKSDLSATNQCDLWV